MSARAVREDEENKAGGSGLGLAAAAAVVGVGLGVGAALYYFLKPQDEPDRPHASGADHTRTFGSLFAPSSPTSESSVMDDSEDMDSVNEEIFRQRAWTLEQCSICFETMLRGESGELWMLPCGHKFHLKCVQPWTQEHNTCPNCRKDI